MSGIPVLQVWGSSDCLSATVNWMDEKSIFDGGEASEFIICNAVFFKT